jgi:hypothetical protein
MLQCYSEFSASLSTYVRPLNGSRVAYEELLTFVQGELPIRAYVTQFRLLQSRTSSVFPDDFLLHLFLGNMRADHQPILALQQPQNLDAAISLSLSYSDAQLEITGQICGKQSCN